MTTVQERLLDRTRMDLGDLPQPFDFQFVGDGVRDHFNVEHRPFDEASVVVLKDGAPINLSVEGITLDGLTGTVVFASAPSPGVLWEIQGQKWRYFSDEDLQTFIDTAVVQHSHNRADGGGGVYDAGDIPPVEEYPVALYATIQALWALATDASFDIDIMAPDGVSIPRSERYRQLMEMIGARQTQYDELAAALNIGVKRMETYTVRRTAKLTNRLVPVFVPQEFGDRTPPRRLYPPISLQGTAPVQVDKGRYDVNLYGSEPYAFQVQIPFDMTGWSEKDVADRISAPIVLHRGSVGPSIEDFAVALDSVDVTDPQNPKSLLTLSLDSESVRKMKNWAFWELIVERSDDVTNRDPHTYLVGNVRHATGAVR
jgi:hypothetical protein